MNYTGHPPRNFSENPAGFSLKLPEGDRILLILARKTIRSDPTLASISRPKNTKEPAGQS
jgi:hypothetical protein